MDLRDLILKLENIENNVLAEAITLKTVISAIMGHEHTDSVRFPLLADLAKKNNLPGLYDPTSGQFVSSDGDVDDTSGDDTIDDQLSKLGLIPQNAKLGTAGWFDNEKVQQGYNQDLRTTSANAMADQDKAENTQVKLSQLKTLFAKFLELKKKIGTAPATPPAAPVAPVKESKGFAQSLVESFGYDFIIEEPISDFGQAGQNVRQGRANAQAEKSAAKQAAQSQALNKAAKYKPPVSTAAAGAAAGESGLAAGIGAIGKKLALPLTAAGESGLAAGIGAIGKKLALPLTAAYEIWDAYKQISAIPSSMPKDQYRKEVAKAITRVVADFGLMVVGAVIGAAITGAVAGPAAFVGGIAGGLAAEFTFGNDVEALINWVVEKLYNGVVTPQGDNAAKTTQQPVAKTPRTINPEIAKLQQDLKAKGANLGTTGPNHDGIDGVMGPLTRTAIEKFGSGMANSKEATELKDIQTQMDALIKDLTQSADPTIKQAVSDISAQLGTTALRESAELLNILRLIK